MQVTTTFVAGAILVISVIGSCEASKQNRRRERKGRLDGDQKTINELKQLKVPCCGFAPWPADTKCANMCIMKKEFKRGYPDYNGNCRCYNVNNMFYYPELVHNYPKAKDTRCKKKKQNKKCRDTCLKIIKAETGRRKWQEGYCYRNNICQCHKTSEENLNYFSEMRPDSEF